MIRLLLPVLVLAFASAGLCAEPPARLLPRSNVLPLALDDTIEFRKTLTFNNDPITWKPAVDDMINFERIRRSYGAVTSYDRLQLEGQYYTFHWRARRPADLKLRFEYTQEKLGAFVQAQERTYKGAKGSFRSEFAVIGDDYRQEGRVTAWRAILIENGKIVALNQSYLWR